MAKFLYSIWQKNIHFIFSFLKVRRGIKTQRIENIIQNIRGNVSLSDTWETHFFPGI